MDWSVRIGRRLKLRDVHILLAVAQSGSMAKAAARLAISQPVVSKTIADLEHTLGVRLLDRNRKGVEVTAYGRAVLNRGLAAFDELRGAVKDIEFLSDPSAGEVRLAATAPILSGLLPVAVDQLWRQHPKLSFHVTEAITGPALFEQLRQRTVEFVVGRAPVGNHLDRDLVSEPLFFERTCVVSGKRHKWAGRRKVVLADLMQEPWILPRPETVPGALIADVFHTHDLAVPRAAVVTICLPVTAALLATGKYIAMLPHSLMRFGAMRESCKILPVQLDATSGQVAIVTLKDRTLSASAQLVIASIRRLAESHTKAGF